MGSRCAGAGPAGHRARGPGRHQRTAHRAAGEPGPVRRLPAFLTRDPGVCSGFMIAQIAAAALVSENKVLSHPASVDSIPTGANKEDHVSMGAHGGPQGAPRAAQHRSGAGHRAAVRGAGAGVPQAAAPGARRGARVRRPSASASAAWTATVRWPRTSRPPPHWSARAFCSGFRVAARHSPASSRRETAPCPPESAVRGWTYEEFARLPDDGNRYEVIAGELYVTPAPGTSTSKCRFGDSTSSFGPLLPGAGGRARVRYAPYAVLFAEGDYLEPDCSWYCRRPRHSPLQARDRRSAGSDGSRFFPTRTAHRTGASSASGTRTMACRSTGSSIRKRRT